MAKKVYLTVDEEQFELIMSFGDDIGYLMLNIGVILSPYDTGNAARSISLTKNNNRIKQITYNTMDANYIKFLEEGIGPVKKHKGYIGVDTRIAIMEGLINYIKTGTYPFISKIPTVQLKDTNNLFSKERQILKAHDIKSDKISADVRRQISRLNEQEYRKNIGNFDFSTKGTKVLETKDFSYGSNRGKNILSKAYKKQMKEMWVK